MAAAHDLYIDFGFLKNSKFRKCVCQVVKIGRFSAYPLVALAIDKISKNEFTQWMIDKRHPGQPVLQQDADGNALAALLSDNYVTNFRRWSFQRKNPDNYHPVMTPDEKGKVYEILDAGKEVGTDAYWALLIGYAREASKK